MGKVLGAGIVWLDHFRFLLTPLVCEERIGLSSP